MQRPLQDTLARCLTRQRRDTQRERCHPHVPTPEAPQKEQRGQDAASASGRSPFPRLSA